MRPGKLERLYQRYRRRGDVRALAEIFDRTAPDLLRLALHWVREPAEAEDLVQETFLHLVEGAGAYDGERPLAAWLSGVVARKASALRRRAERAPEPGRLHLPRPEEPSEHLSAREVRTELARALARMEAGERELLVAYLEEGRSPGELALERGLSPGTVRMRIHRGLERLRRLLPLGVSAGLYATTREVRGLAAVRELVLARASTTLVLSGSALTTTVTTTLALSTMTKTTTTLAGLALLALLSGGAYWVSQSTGEQPASAGERNAGPASVGEPLAPFPSLAAPEATQLAPAGLPAEESRQASTGRHFSLEGEVRGLRPEHRATAIVHVYAEGAQVVRDASGNAIASAFTDVLEGATQRQALLSVGSQGEAEAQFSQGIQIVLGQIVPDQTDDASSDLVVSSDRQGPAGPLRVARALGAPWQPRAYFENRLAGPPRGPEIGTAAVDEQGRFQLDLTHVLEGWTQAERPLQLRIVASEEHYFDGKLMLEDLSSGFARYDSGESVALEVSLDMRIAAVVRASLQEAWNVRRESASCRSCHAPEQAQEDARKDEIAIFSGTISFRAVYATGESGEFSLMLVPGCQRGDCDWALFPSVEGNPLPEAVSSGSTSLGEKLEMKLAEGGTYELLVLQDDLHPITRHVQATLGEVRDLGELDFPVGAAVDGTLLVAPDASGCEIRATRVAQLGELPFDHEDKPLAFGPAGFVWRERKVEVEANGQFHIGGLGATFHELAIGSGEGSDVRLGARGHVEQVLAPASGLLLAPEFALVELSITSGGVPLEELPPIANEGDVEGLAEQAPRPFVRLRQPVVADPDSDIVTDQKEVEHEFPLEGRTKILLVLDPGTAVDLELVAGGAVRDRIHLVTPAAGQRALESLDL